MQPVNPTASLRMRDAQGLVLWVLADGVNPRWVFVKVRPLACPWSQLLPFPALQQQGIRQGNACNADQSVPSPFYVRRACNQGV